MDISHTFFIVFFFNDTATTEIYTLSLHDALPIYIISSQIEIHKKYGGVVPEVAARHHVLNILPVLEIGRAHV